MKKTPVCRCFLISEGVCLRTQAPGVPVRNKRLDEASPEARLGSRKHVDLSPPLSWCCEVI